MSIVKQYYHVILQSGDGEVRRWQVTNNYFTRRMEVISREMQEAIRQHDKDNQFKLTENPHQRDCPWHGVDLDNDDHCDQMDDTPCLCAKEYQVTLVNIETNETKDWTGTASDRYDAVGQTFMAITGKTQGDNLDEWKVLSAQEIS
jgi:hypothetical protein